MAYASIWSSLISASRMPSLIAVVCGGPICILTCFVSLALSISFQSTFSIFRAVNSCIIKDICGERFSVKQSTVKKTPCSVISRQ